ncbi:unnamed protein product [Aphanomyces euteiches]
MAVSTEAVFSQKNDQVAAWIPVFPYDPQVKVGYVRTFRSFFVLSGRQDGLTQLWIGSKDKSGKWQKQLLKMNDAMYSISGATNAEFDTDVFRFTYSSLTTPLQTLEYNTKTEVARLRERKTDSNQILLKMDMEAGHFSASDRYYFLKEKAIEISFLLDKLHLIQ